MKNFIAIAPKGHEFIYKKSTMISTPAASAQRIANILNKSNYLIQAGETWHVYESGYYEKDFIFKKARIYKNRVRITATY